MIFEESSLQANASFVPSVLMALRLLKRCALVCSLVCPRPSLGVLDAPSGNQRGWTSPESGCGLQQISSAIPNRASVHDACVHTQPTVFRPRDGLSALASLRLHWPEYLMEAGELGLTCFADVPSPHWCSIRPRPFGSLFPAAFFAAPSWVWVWAPL